MYGFGPFSVFLFLNEPTMDLCAFTTDYEISWDLILPRELVT